MERASAPKCFAGAPSSYTAVAITRAPPEGLMLPRGIRSNFVLMGLLAPRALTKTFSPIKSVVKRRHDAAASQRAGAP
jgi:hypothetical protein